MKIAKLLSILFLTTLLFSCSKDNNDELIVGKWQMTEFNYNGYSKTNSSDFELTSTFDGVGYDMSLIVEFKEDGKYISSGSYSIKLTQTIEGNSSTTNVTNQGFSGTGTWTVSDDKLTLSSSNDGANITELNESTLKFEYTTKNTITQGDLSVETEFTAYYTFTKK